MSQHLKRDEIPPFQARHWRLNFGEEQQFTFNLNLSNIILQKETYKKLAGENENRIRIYPGLDEPDESGRYTLCAFAVSAFQLGSGDVYVDYETPVYKLEKQNIDYSSKIAIVLEKIRLYRQWRDGEIDNGNEYAVFRKCIYPNSYLLTKFELHEIFNVRNRQEAQIGFGISKSMMAMIYPDVADQGVISDDTPVFDYSMVCPPNCGEGSIYNI